MNDNNVNALTKLLTRAGDEGISVAPELAKYLADNGVLACECITDDEAINKITPRIKRHSPTPGYNLADTLRETLYDFARGVLVG